MAKRGRNTQAKQAAQIGTNRGGRAFVEAAPVHTAEVVGDWDLVDAKPGRAASLAAVVQARFPTIRAVPHEADGRGALGCLADDALIVGTLDTIEATRALVETRKPDQSLLFQLVGRGPGPALTATRLGLSGAIRDAHTSAEAALLLEALERISAAASSRALTAAGDPVSAALLQPMRLATTRQTARFFDDVLRGDAFTDTPLQFFTSSGQYPLVVRPTAGNIFSAQKALALEAMERLGTRRVGAVAAVALVDADERCIDVLFVRTTRADRRHVEGVLSFRAPSQRFAASARWTD